jgi:hypothetical protein
MICCQGVDWIQPGSCEHGNEISGFIKGGEFLEQLSDNPLLREDSSVWKCKDAMDINIIIPVQTPSNILTRQHIHRNCKMGQASNKRRLSK